MREKAEKRNLEKRITALTSQMLTGGAGPGVAVENTPAFRSAVQVCE